MATLKNGVNGGFSGTVGSVIGSSWKGIDYMKGKHRLKKYRKPPTGKQQFTRDKFKEIGEFFVSFKDVLRVGLGQRNLKRMTPYNLAFKLNKNAFERTGDTIRIDFSRIVLSKGAAVSKPGMCSVEWREGPELDVRWEIFGHCLTERPTDRIVLTAYCEEEPEAISDIGHRTRAHCEMRVAIPQNWVDRTVHVYLFMVSEKGLCSETVYVGPLKIN